MRRVSASARTASGGAEKVPRTETGRTEALPGVSRRSSTASRSRWMRAGVWSQAARPSRQVWASAAARAESDGDAVDGGLLEEADAETGLAAAGHAHAQGVGGQVAGVEEQGLRVAARGAACAVAAAAEVEETELFVCVHGRLGGSLHVRTYPWVRSTTMVARGWNRDSARALPWRATSACRSARTSESPTPTPIPNFRSRSKSRPGSPEQGQLGPTPGVGVGARRSEVRRSEVRDLDCVGRFAIEVTAAPCQRARMAMAERAAAAMSPAEE